MSNSIGKWWMTVAGVVGVAVFSGCGKTETPLGTVASASDGKPCTVEGKDAPAADGCNTCTCEPNGHWSCTKDACGQAPPSCQAGDMKKDDCNTCSCDDGGKWACTEIACDPAPEACKPGDVKADDCNKCSCTDSGTWVCTDVACGGMPPAPQCKVGDVVADDCKKCACTEDGTWSCDDMGCTTAPPAADCKPGDFTSIDCNKCTCTGDGKWACTEFTCGSPEPAPQCKEGDTKKDVCIECSCKGGEWQCNQTCPTTPVCFPGLFMNLDCNTCTCTPDGQWSCTKLTCPPVSYTCKKQADQTCEKFPTYSLDPATGTCCYWDFACEVPAEQKVFPTLFDCAAATQGVPAPSK